MYVNNSTFNLGATSFSISSSDLSASNSLVSAYLYILKSRTTLEEVIQLADLSYSPDELVKMIETRSVSETGAFEVTVTSTNPAEVELIANSIAKVLPERIAEIVDGTSVRIVDYAIIPSQRSGPSIVKNTILGILIGGILSVIVIILKYMINDTSRMMIQSVDDLRAMYPDMMVLATIPDMRLNEKKNGYYSTYYAQEESSKKEGKHNGRR
jgi:capsular polysaccharide biosynthesis protein